MYRRPTRHSVAGWMIAGGARIDEPDARYLEHITSRFATPKRSHEPSRSRPLDGWIGAAPRRVDAGG